MLAISRNVNYYRISTQFAITKLFCEQNFWPMDAFDIVRKLVDKMIFLLEYPFRSYMIIYDMQNGSSIFVKPRRLIKNK